MLKSAVESSLDLADNVNRGWLVLLEALASRAPHPNVNLHGLVKRIQEHGWTAGLIREFEALTEPVFEAGRPHNLREPQPPSGDWSDVEWPVVAHIHIRFPSYTISWPTVPDDNLSSVYAALERNLLRACTRIQEVSEIGWDSADAPPESRDRNAFVNLFRETLDRLARRDADRVKLHIALWPDPDPHIFDRLRLGIWSNSTLFSGTETADHVLALSDVQCWRDTDRKKLLSLLHSRWEHFSADHQRRIGERILNGPPRTEYEDETSRRAISAACLGWLIQNNCALPDDLVERWGTLKDSVPGWDDSWIADAGAVSATRKSGPVNRNEDASVFDGVPIGDIVRVARENSGHVQFVVNEPFTGLVKTRPGRALRALSAAARRGEWPRNLWDSALRHWPDNATPRETSVLYGLLLRLPAETIVAMPYSVGEWLKEQFPALAADDKNLAYALFDRFIEAVLTTDSEEMQASRPTLTRAINSPPGKAIQGLIKVLSRENPNQGAGFPEDFKLRFDRFLSASGEGTDDAVCVLSSQIAWLNRIDPSWGDTKMIPWFQPGHDRFEPAWNGVLGNWNGIQPLFGKIKDGFVALPTTMHEWRWRIEIERFCEQVVLLALSDGILPFEAARRCLRRIRPEEREHAIWFLGRVGAENDDGWRKLVIPFIRNAWPKERRFRTSGTISAWVSLLCDTGDAFPEVLDAVWDLLDPVDWRRIVLLDIEPLAKKFPEQTLKLLNRVVPDEVHQLPWGLSRLLDLLAEADPDLISEPRYRRLHRLVAQE